MTTASQAALELRQRADWLRDLPDRMRAEVERSGWTGATPQALSGALARIGMDLTAAADLHELAAAALVAHGAEPAAGGSSW